MQNSNAMQKNQKCMYYQRTIRKAGQKHICFRFPNCPTPPIKKYINLKGLPNIDTAFTIFAFENRSYLVESNLEAEGFSP
jgi:hypothetical protein